MLHRRQGGRGLTHRKKQYRGGLKVTLKNKITLKKDDDGEIRPINGEIQPDQNVKIKQGYVEESNVNAIDELVASMGYQRSYELNMKLIKTASELDENTASLLRLPNG